MTDDEEARGCLGCTLVVGIVMLGVGTWLWAGAGQAGMMVGALLIGMVLIGIITSRY